MGNWFRKQEQEEEHEIGSFPHLRARAVCALNSKQFVIVKDGVAGVHALFKFTKDRTLVPLLDGSHLSYHVVAKQLAQEKLAIASWDRLWVLRSKDNSVQHRAWLPLSYGCHISDVTEDRIVSVGSGEMRVWDFQATTCWAVRYLRIAKRAMFVHDTVVFWYRESPDLRDTIAVFELCDGTRLRQLDLNVPCCNSHWRSVRVFGGFLFVVTDMGVHAFTPNGDWRRSWQLTNDVLDVTFTQEEANIQMFVLREHSLSVLTIEL